MCGPHHCLGRDAFASGPEILCRLLQLRQNASILEKGCAGFSPGSANRCDQFTRHPGRTSSPLRPDLDFRYTQAKKTKKKIVRREYTKADVNELRAHSKGRTPLAKIVKLTKRTEGSLRQKALKLGISLGHRR